MLEKCSSSDSSCIIRDIIDECVQLFNGKKNRDSFEDSESEESENESDSPDITEKLIDKIVSPAIEEFEQIGNLLSSSRISLKMVNKLFGSYKTDLKGIFVELLSIGKVLQLDGSKWENDVWERISQYFNMFNLQNIANILLKVRAILGIEQIFPELEKILDSGQNDENEALLNSVSEKDIRFGQTFSNWSNENIEAIQAIEKCQALIKWLRDHMQNFQEFKFFVDLASISAGESDVEVDRVMFMQSAITAYSSFIWDIGADSDLQTFLNSANQLINALLLDSKIPDKFVDTNRHLPWIKAIKERHGSVETSSLQQVEAINSTGVYKIGQWELHMDKLLSLKFQQIDGVIKGNKEYQKELCETELNELRSKLMLISKSSESTAAVDRFVQGLQYAERLKLAGRQLYDAGCNLFRRVTILIYCDSSKKKKVEVDLGTSGLLGGSLPLEIELPSLAEFLESSLMEWNQHLNELRGRYSSLNFFRTDQLVELSNSVAKCLNGENLPLHSRMILNKMSKAEVSEDVIRDTFTKAATPKENIETIEIVELDGDDLIQMLVNDFSVEEEIAQAAIMANVGVNDIEELFQWCMDNQLEDTVIERLCKKYNEAKKMDSELNVEEMNDSRPTFSEFTKVIVERVSSVDTTLQKKLQEIWSSFLNSVETAETSDFLNFECIGSGLQKIHDNTAVSIDRTYPGYLTSGKPNLVQCQREDIHNVALTLYNHDHQKPLPGIDEVLLCNEETTKEDVELICRRAFNDKLGKIYTVLYAEKLDFTISINTENLLMKADIPNREYRLVFICCKDSIQQSYLATALDKYRAQVPEFKDPSRLKMYIENHLRRQGVHEKTDPTLMRVIQSTRSGMGKSLQVQRIAERFGYNLDTVQIHEKVVNSSALVSRWQRNAMRVQATLFII